MFRKLINYKWVVLSAMLASFAFLSACTNIDRFDNYFTNPIPAGAKDYMVNGKHYQVLSSSKGYDVRGQASWYGPQFNHKFTSSGERFNMYKLTAASKVLPLGTYVLVTNLQNNRQVIVKVNDRGPFVGSRVMDLSYAAAKKLKMVGEGVQQVEIKAISSVTVST